MNFVQASDIVDNESRRHTESRSGHHYSICLYEGFLFRH